VEMRTQGMECYLLYVLQMSKPGAFEELGTKVHNMEITIMNYVVKPPLFLKRGKTRVT